MITYQELLATPEYWTTRLQLDLYNMIKNYIETNNLTQVDLANKLGVSKGYVSQVLNGNFDHRISKFVELSLAVGMIPQISYVPMDKMFAKDTLSETTIASIDTENAKVPVQRESFIDIASSMLSKVEEETVYKHTSSFLIAA